MKRIITILCVSAMLLACKTETKKELKTDGYVISGNAPGVYNGIRVYLKSADERGRQINRDTAIVMNERFVFEGKIDQPEMWYLNVNSMNGNMPLIVENAAIEIDINSDDLTLSKVSGTKTNDDFVTYFAQVKKLATKQKELQQQMKNVAVAEKAPITEQLIAINQKLEKLPYEFIQENPASPFSLILLENTLKAKDINIKRLSDAYENIDESLKSNALGTAVAKQLEMRKIEYEAKAATQIGAVAPKFTAPTPEGKQLALNDVLGKVTIIDFWAAWCGPCRRENPNVVKVYNKYHDKGLEIIGVSLDGTPKQKDPKDAWLKAIKQDNLTWHQVSNLNYFNDPVAKAYNIKSIPATYILDENGTIIAKNLRGPQLEAKIAELLD